MAWSLYVYRTKVKPKTYFGNHWNIDERERTPTVKVFCPNAHTTKACLICRERIRRTFLSQNAKNWNCTPHREREREREGWGDSHKHVLICVVEREKRLCYLHNFNRVLLFPLTQSVSPLYHYSLSSVCLFSFTFSIIFFSLFLRWENKSTFSHRLHNCYKQIYYYCYLFAKTYIKCLFNFRVLIHYISEI